MGDFFRKFLCTVFLATFVQVTIVIAKKPRCFDQDRRCQEWLEKGDCGKSEVKTLCRKSCKRCAPNNDDFLYEVITRGIEDTHTVLYCMCLLLVLGILIGFIKLNRTCVICRSKGNLKGKVVVITGATNGIGYETAFRLALKGAKIIIGCSNLKKGLKIAKQLRDYTGQQYIEARKLDLASLASVREFSKDICEDFPCIDILVNNAAIVSGIKREETIDKNETTWQINYLSHFLLTKILLQKIRLSAQGRIINVVCDSYKKANFVLTDLQSNNKFSPIIAYNNTKLALLLFTQELAAHLNEKVVTVNAVNPGKVSTSLRRNIFPYNWRILRILSGLYAYVFWKTPSEAVETILYGCLEKNLEGVSGKLLEECAEAVVPEYDKTIVKTLWDESERLITPEKIANFL
ncbi:retinol dehydrogenase 13 [Hydra vulgaris]|uniref:retinol dehydrogenase 13 n=1 Tax=Hydra vulgaris TaxID=6087 RepID=UPI001F5EEC0B|nr:retinol dehydrogenase 13 [Hydra vulgaris]